MESGAETGAVIEFENTESAARMIAAGEKMLEWCGEEVAVSWLREFEVPPPPPLGNMHASLLCLCVVVSVQNMYFLF